MVTSSAFQNCTPEQVHNLAKLVKCLESVLSTLSPGEEKVSEHKHRLAATVATQTPAADVAAAPENQPVLVAIPSVHKNKYTRLVHLMRDDNEPRPA